MITGLRLAKRLTSGDKCAPAKQPSRQGIAPLVFALRCCREKATLSRCWRLFVCTHRQLTLAGKLVGWRAWPALACLRHKSEKRRRRLRDKRATMSRPDSRPARLPYLRALGQQVAAGCHRILAGCARAILHRQLERRFQSCRLSWLRFLLSALVGR